MSQAVVSKLGKKSAIYIPKRIVERLGLREGDTVIIKADDSRLILEFFPDPLSLALKVKRWAKTTTKEFENESEEDQNALSSR